MPRKPRPARLPGEPLTAVQLLVLFGWEAAELSEGQAAKLLGTDRVSARGLRERALADVRHVAAGGLPNVTVRVVRVRSDD